MKYTKPPTTFKGQLQILKDRGLIVKDESKTIDILQNISYYRLSAYFIPFQSEVDKFNQNTTIDDVITLYEFDRHLRDLLWDAIESVEISVRTQVTYHLAHTYGAFGYRDSQNFNSKFDHSKWLEKLKKNVKASKEVFIKHFFERYEEVSLPIWMATEILSFGQLSNLFYGLKKADKQSISREKYGLDQSIISSWIHTLVYIRNLCAHHSRIWNRILAIKPVIPRKDTEWNNINNKKIFSVLLVIKRLMCMSDEWEEWRASFLTMMGKFPNVNIKSMGFPDNWEEYFPKENSTKQEDKETQKLIDTK